MLSDSGKVKDPVCEMWVAPEPNAVNCLGMRFAFCSQQCKERFLANPHLYSGLPGEPAPKQTGQQVVKRRRLRLEAPLSGPGAQRLVERLHDMMGVFAVEIKAEELTITTICSRQRPSRSRRRCSRRAGTRGVAGPRDCGAR
jgi:YHS domain-containing protein